MYKRIIEHFTPVSPQEHTHSLYVISGISGSGKTTLGKALSDLIGEITYIDQDEFYLEDKPQVTLSDGSQVSNWDCFEAIDPDFTAKIAQALELTPVILVGFALPDCILPVRPEFHIHLVTANTSEELSARCKQARIQAKPGLDEAKDALMVDEVVIPFYHAVTAISDITDILPVYDGKRHIPSMNLSHMAQVLMTSNVRLQQRVMDISEPYHSLIYSREKVAEGRKMSKTWTNLKVGDELWVTCGISVEQCTEENKGSGPGKWFAAEITHISRYFPSCGDPLTVMLNDRLHDLLPNINCVEEGRKIYLQWSSEDEIRSMGTMAIDLKVVE